jgi:hypothetical protein
MASALLANRLEAEKERRTSMLARARGKAQAAAQSQQHTLVALGAAYAIGAAEKRAIALPTVNNLDPKLLYGVAALAAGYMLSDKKQRTMANSIGDGLLAIVAYNSGKGESVMGSASDTQAGEV